jgi:hypothetical protein
MKTKFTLLCLLFSVALIAQVTNLPTVLQVNNEGGNAISVMPKQLSYDGSNRVYIRTADDQVAIYGNDFTPVKSITITPTCYKESHIEKEATVTISLVTENIIYDNSYNDIHLQVLYLANDPETGEAIYSDEVPDSWTNEDMKSYLERGGDRRIVSISTHPEGGTWFFYDMADYQADGSNARNYYKVNLFGKKYPKSAYLWRDKYLYYEYINYSDNSEYAKSYGEWRETGIRSEWEGIIDIGIGFINYDTDPSIEYFFQIGNGLCLTQTLFNSDDKYEYLQFPCEQTEETSDDYDGPSNNGEYESNTYTTTKTFHKYSLYKGFNIISEEGSILQSITFPNGFEMMEWVEAEVIQISNEFYILCQGKMNNSETLLIYKINRSSVGASVEQVCAPIKVGAFPSVANRNQMITIQLSGDNAGNNQTYLQVVDMQGKVLNQQTIPAGQTSTTIPAHRLSNGMNLIKITQGSKTIGTEKVIIK